MEIPFIRRVYDWTLHQAVHPKAPIWLGIISFLESSVFPVPPDAMLLPMAMARPDRAWRLAAICTAASVAGGVLGYAIGYWLFDVLARPIIEAYGYGAGFARFQELYAEWGLWVILIKGLTPIPYKIVTIASGAAHFDFLVFLLASIVTRGARFLMVALVAAKFGPPMLAVIERRLTLFTLVFLVLLVGGFALVRFL